MGTEQLLNLGVFGILLCAVVATAWYVTARRGGDVQVIEDSLDWLGELKDAAEMWVEAAEQLHKTGRIDNRFDFVYDHLRTAFPDVRSTWIKAAIEAAVYFVNNRQSPEK